jgi:hypothetical protein
MEIKSPLGDGSFLAKIIEQGKVYAIIPIMAILGIWDLAKGDKISYLAVGSIVAVVLLFLLFRLIYSYLTGNGGTKND